MKNERILIGIIDRKRRERERERERERNKGEMSKKRIRIVRNTQVEDDYPSPEPILDSSKP